MPERPGAAEPAAGERRLKTRVKKKRRSAVSTRWLERQLNDPYVPAPEAEGYRSRSAYKLIEIDDRFQPARARHAGHRPRRGARRLVPGRRRAGALDRRRQPRVVGIDYLDMDPLPGVDRAEEGFSRRRGAAG